MSIDIPRLSKQLEQVSITIDNIGDEVGNISIMNKGYYRWKTCDLLDLIRTCKEYTYHLTGVHSWVDESNNDFCISPTFSLENLEISITVRVSS